MKQFVSLALVALFCFGAQANEITNPDYDAELAERLRADEYGMASYVFVFLNKGENYEMEAEARGKLLRGHLDNIGRLAEAGSLVLAGPFGGHEKTAGILILDVESVDEAHELAATDPAVEAGIFSLELVQWYGSAGLRGLNEIHRKIGQTMP